MHDPNALLRNPNARTALDYFQGQGWSPAQASGIIANLFAESGIDPAKLQNDKGPGYGIAQWERPRQLDFQNWAHQPVQGSSLQDQLEFVQHELTDGSRRDTGTALKLAPDPAKAALTVMQGFEGPKDSQSDGPNAVDRMRLAERFHDALFPPDDGDTQPAQVTAQPITPQPLSPQMFAMPRLST